MSIVMDMSSYWHEVPEPDTVSTEPANWSDNPLPSLALHVSQTKTLQMPSDLTTLDAELFLQRIYTYQR